MKSKKGFSEILASAMIIIASIVVFVLAMFYIFNYFVTYSEKVSFHEQDRKVSDFSENFLTNCSLLYSRGVFDEDSLTRVNNSLTEPCSRYCELGVHISIDDTITQKHWSFGYMGEENENHRGASFGVGIRNSSGEIHAGRILISISDDYVTRISCAVDKAYSTGETQYISILKGKLDSNSNMTIESTADSGGSVLCISAPFVAWVGDYEMSSYYKYSTLCRRLYNATRTNSLVLFMNKDRDLNIFKYTDWVAVKDSDEESGAGVE